MISNQFRVFPRLLTLAVAGAVLITTGNTGFAAAAPASVLGRDPVLEAAIGRVFPALVRIFVLSDNPEGGRIGKQPSAGSGAVISEDGYIITNHHVAGKARHLVCRMYDGEEIEAKLVGTDALGDIAIIKLDLSRRKNKTPLAVAKFGDSDKVRVGDTVLAMGSPMAVSQSVTKGIVANTSLMLPSVFGDSGMKMDGENVGSLVRWIGHDAVIYHGNSGGPLVDLRGDIVGINEVGLASLGGAIPANLAKSIAEQIIKQGHVERSWTGIEAQARPKSLAVARGVLIGGVIAASPAARAGLQPGDVITKFDGEVVDAEIQEDLPAYNALEMSMPIGKKVALTVLRAGQEKKFQVQTTSRGRAENNDLELKDWGLTARNLTMLGAIEKKRTNTDGAEVTSIEPGGPAAATIPELKEGDVIVAVEGQPVKATEDLRRISAELLKDVTGQRAVQIVFERGVSQYLTLAKLPHRETPPEETPRKPALQMILQPVGVELAEALGIKSGARVAFVFPGRGADKAGLRVGDILTRFDGDVIRCQQPEDVGQLLGRVRKYKIGAEVEFEFLRGKETRKTTLTLEADGPPVDELKRWKDRDFELTVRELTEMERVTQRIPEHIKGVRVDEVLAAGWAALAKVRTGDLLMAIDGTPTPDVDTAEKLLKAAAVKKVRQLVFFLRRGVHSFYAELEPGWDDSSDGATAPKTR